jgi:hypothetical protein
MDGRFLGWGDRVHRIHHGTPAPVTRRTKAHQDQYGCHFSSAENVASRNFKSAVTTDAEDDTIHADDTAKYRVEEKESYAFAGVVNLERIQLEQLTLRIGVVVERRKDGKDGGESESVDTEEGGPVTLLDRGNDSAVGEDDCSAEAERLIDEGICKKLEWKHEEQNEQQESAVQYYNACILKTVAAKENELPVPEPVEHSECEGERNETAHRGEELTRGAGDFE